MTKIRSKYKKFPAQMHILKQIVQKLFMYFVLNCGRGFSKSVIEQEVVLHYCTRKDKSRDVLFLSATDDQLKKNNFNPLKKRLKNIAKIKPIHTKILSSKGSREIHFVNGSRCDFKSAHNPDAIRGANEYHIIIIDEAAFTHEDIWNELLQISKFRADGVYVKESKIECVIIASTPNGHNWFKVAYDRGLDPTDDKWTCYHYTSKDNPVVDPEVIAKDMAKLPKWKARQEYGAEFIEGGFGVFEDVDEKCRFSVRTPWHLAYALDDEDIEPLYMGIDIALGGNDDTAIVILDQMCNIIGVFHLNKKIPETFKTVEALINFLKPKRVLIESNADLKFVEDLRKGRRKQINALLTTGGQQGEGSKIPLIEDLIVAYECDVLKVPNHKELKKQLGAYTKEDTPSGNYTYNASGKDEQGNPIKDDLVIALSLAYRVWKQYSRKFKYAYEEVKNKYTHFIDGNKI